MNVLNLSVQISDAAGQLQKPASLRIGINLMTCRVGQKSKLLILSECVNKTEKVGGT